MDFEDSGIESDPKHNSEKETLKQHNEPIISFSPERCRFDSAQSSSRKSSTSFAISVADLQLDEPLPSLTNNNLNSITNFQNSSKTPNDGVPNSKTATIHHQLTNEHVVNQPLFTNAHNKQQQQLKQTFPFLHNQQQHHPQNPSLSTHCPISSLSSSATTLQGPTTLVISSTHALSSTTSSSASANTASATPINRAITTAPLLQTRSSLDSPSISLMVNGAVLSANNNATTTPAPPTGTSTSTTLDLQKRLEKRIAQASAIAAAAAASSSSSSSTSTTNHTSTSSTSPFTSTSTPGGAAETKGNDSILSDIISASGIANKAITISPTASTTATSTTTTSSSGGKNYGNQISFSPQKSTTTSTTLFSAASDQLNLQEKLMPSSSPTLWESDLPSSSSAIDLWENKIAVSGGVDGFMRAKESITDSFMDVSPASQVHTSSHSQQPPTSASISDILSSREKGAESGAGGGTTPADCIAQFDLTCNSAAAATTSCTTVNTSGVGVATSSTCTGGGSANSKNNNNIGNINKSSSSKNNTSNKPKGNQSLRNNNNHPPTTSTVLGGGGDAVVVPPSSAAAYGGGGGGSAPTSGAAASSSSSASVITVVNASFDIRKVSALLPPQRLAIPSKSNPQLQSSHSVNTKARSGSNSSLSATSNPSSGTAASAAATVTFSSFGSNGASNPHPPSASAYGSSTTAAVHKTSTTGSSRHGSVSETSCSGIIQPPSGNGNIKMGSHHNSSKLSTDSEKKPLVQWDSDESEEELSFFPPAKRGVITDNLSIDNMSLSGEEEDLHLTPPRPLAKKCPCDPRTWLDRTDISSHHHHGDPTRSISSKFSCTIS